jgi:hypothetical protein
MFIILICCGCPTSPPPSDWSPRIISGESYFTKIKWFVNADMGPLTNISIENKITLNKTNYLISIASSQKALFVDEKGNIKERVNFNLNGNHIVRLDSFPKTKIAFLNRGGGWGPVAVYDRAGNCLWSYGTKKEGGETPENMAAGDIDNDGQPEFALGTMDSIMLLNHEGKIIWRRPDNLVRHIEIIDINSDGIAEIVHSNASGKMIIRNRDGDMQNEIKLFLYFNWFSLIQWPIPGGTKKCLLISADKKIQIIDPSDGKKIRLFDAPDAPDNFGLGVWVDFQGSKNPYFAVIVAVRATWRRALLYIYSPQGDLLYQEILPTYNPALASLKISDDKKEALLVGGNGVIWEYKLLANPD